MEKYLFVQKSGNQLQLGGSTYSLNVCAVSSVLKLMDPFYCLVPWLCSEVNPLKSETYSGVNVKEWWDTINHVLLWSTYHCISILTNALLCRDATDSSDNDTPEYCNTGTFVLSRTIESLGWASVGLQGAVHYVPRCPTPVPRGWAPALRTRPHSGSYTAW